MSVLPRALLAIAFVLGTTLVPTAVADDCVDVKSSDVATGLRLIANAGRQIALGFTTGVPGDGLGFVVIITPTLCSGLGIGGLDDGGSLDDPTKLIPGLPDLIPLP